ncbi:hypothetical protein [Cytobacillus oceanisediminis]|uniref:hypothetical protein n=1 Tax=Cytobacillus oceanisediminis TaxID=665099 RepID=UPI003734E47F
MKYRKRPIVIEAVKYTLVNLKSANEFAGDKLLRNWPDTVHWIDTLEGKMKLSEGDYIIKGVNGEFYPCKPDIFRKTYEEVEGE